LKEARSLWTRHQLDSGQFSYNLGISTSLFVLFPRLNEGTLVASGFVALNGSILAGGLMVKGQTEWEELQKDGGLLESLLGKIGIPNSQSPNDKEDI